MARLTEFTGFTDAERDYLRRQPLGRLATVDAAGQPQVNPVGFFLQDDGTLLIGGAAMGRTKKWRNLQANPKTALVVDDLASTVPWRPRGIEIRGTAELTTGRHELGAPFSPEVIRLHPAMTYSWNLDT